MKALPASRSSFGLVGMGIAVIGAGLSGLVCARELQAGGHRVRVFEKARGPGGRMATRRAGSLRFDHGAQYFTVRDSLFAREVESWQAFGLVDRWQGRIAVIGTGEASRRGGAGTDRFVAVPGMSAICGRLAEPLDVSFGTRVEGIERASGKWRLMLGAAGPDAFDAVVVSAPAPQASALLAPVAPAIAESAMQVEMSPCWAVMAAFERPLELAFDGAFVNVGPLSWIARNASKPGRPAGECWVLHGSPSWSREHLEIARSKAASRLLEAFRAAVDSPIPEPVHLDSHRWRFALPERPLPESFLYDESLGLGACGDWCAGPRVEGAFLSGLRLAQRLLA